jgi:predicted AAA+ superfamily ATPase
MYKQVESEGLSMLRRKIYDKLAEWKSRGDKQCLVVKGARQVGKTFIIERFARENYKHTTTLNFEKNPAYRTGVDTKIMYLQFCLDRVY